MLHDDIEPSFRQRVADSLETTLKLGNGVVLVSVVDGEEILFSERAACVYCGISLPEIAPRTFSFNNPHGACPACTGLGMQQEIDPELIVSHPNLSISEGAISPYAKVVNGSQWHGAIMEAMAERYNFNVNTPWNELSYDIQQKILYGVPESLSIHYTPQHGRVRTYNVHFEGVIANLDKKYKETTSESVREEIEQYMSMRLCPVCHGARLKPETLAVTVGGRNIVQVTQLAINKAQHFFQELELDHQETPTPTPLPNAVVQANGHGKKKKNPNTPEISSHLSLLGDPLARIDVEGSPLVLGTLTERERFIARQILKEIRARLQFSARCRSGLPDTEPSGDESFWWRGTTHSPGNTDWVGPNGCALHPRRAKYWSPPA